MRQGSTRAVRLARTAALAATAVVSVVALAACSSGTAGTPVDQPDQNYVGGSGAVTEKAPAGRRDPVELAGPTLDGETLDLAALRGKVVVINVWGSWCPPCRKEAPVLKAVSDDLVGDDPASSDVAFVGIDTRDSDAAAKAFLENVGITYPNIVDPDGVLLLAFKGDLNPNAIPSTLLLDKQGRVATRIVGEVSEGTLRALIEPLVAEQA